MFASSLPHCLLLLSTTCHGFSGVAGVASTPGVAVVADGVASTPGVVSTSCVGRVAPVVASTPGVAVVVSGVAGSGIIRLLIQLLMLPVFVVMLLVLVVLGMRVRQIHANSVL